MFLGCGPDDDGSVNFRYQLFNNTGAALVVSTESETFSIPNGEFYECQTLAFNGYIGAFCSTVLEIRQENTNIGYRCYGTESDSEGLCFVEDFRLFNTGVTTALTEVESNVYRYTMEPSFFDNAFDLP